MSPYLLLTVARPALSLEEPAHGGNAPAEVLLVFLIMIVIWGAFRISSKKRP